MCSYVPVKEMDVIDVYGISNNQLIIIIIIISHAKSDKYVAVRLTCILYFKITA